MSSSSMTPRARLRHGTVPSMAKVVIVAVAFLSSLCLPTSADARTLLLHCHGKHRRHHVRHHRAAANNALPPAALPPDYVDADPPGVEDAPPPRARDGKPCPPPRPPSKQAAPRSARAPAKQPDFSSSKPPAKAPSHSHGTSPSHPPTLAHAKRRPSLSPAKPPSPSPASTPSRSPGKAPAPLLSAPSKPPSFPPLHATSPPCTSSQPPRLAAVKPPLLSPPARTPLLSPGVAQPPANSPKTSHATAPVPSIVEPPQHAPTNPPTPSPTQPPTPVNPPVSAPVAKNGSACGKVLDVRAFGASGNGSSEDDTRAFRAAWKAACSSDFSTLLVPSDGVFTITSTVFAGPCKPGLTFQIDGVLMPPGGPGSWPASDSRKQWVVFYRADGMTLAGRGTIEGNGEEWWDLPCKPHRGPNGSTLPGPCDSPALVRFFLSNDVTVRGLRVENSPKFHLKFDDCRRVHVDGLFVSSPAFSPNTDGIHVENTTDVQILNSRIYNGDDCVSIGAGCSGVHIENVTCGHGHGISIGSLGVGNTRACVTNVTVRNARIIDSDNGVRIKTWQGGAGAVSAVEFAGVRMQNVKSCIVIDQYYCLGAGCANQTSAVRVAGVTYRDIRGTYNPRGGPPIRLACSDAVACTGITMSGVELVPAGGTRTQLADPFCWNAYGLMETVTLPPVFCLQEGRPESLQDELTGC